MQSNCKSNAKAQECWGYLQCSMTDITDGPLTLHSRTRMSSVPFFHSTIRPFSSSKPGTVCGATRKSANKFEMADTGNAEIVTASLASFWGPFARFPTSGIDPRVITIQVRQSRLLAVIVLRLAIISQSNGRHARTAKSSDVSGAGCLPRQPISTALHATIPEQKNRKEACRPVMARLLNGADFAAIPTSNGPPNAFVQAIHLESYTSIGHQ